MIGIVMVNGHIIEPTSRSVLPLSMFSSTKVLLQTYIEHLRGLVEDKKTINHHGEMRVIKLEEDSKEGNEVQAAIEKPGSAWRPLEEGGGNSLECFTTWGLSLKSVRKY